MPEPLTQEVLEAAHCWEAEDRAGTPAMTEFRRRSRYHQAMWREARGYPIGTQPYRPEARRPAGAARRQPAPARLRPARPARPSSRPTPSPRRDAEPRPSSATRASTASGRGPTSSRRRRCRSTCSATSRPTTRWPTMPSTPGGRTRPGTVADVRFEHSPGRLDPAYLNSLRRFDAAFVLDGERRAAGDRRVDVNYHERMKAEVPKPTNLWRYLEVAVAIGRVPTRAPWTRSRAGPCCASRGSSTCCCCRCSSTRAAPGGGAATSSSTRRATRTSPSCARGTGSSSPTRRRSCR